MGSLWQRVYRKQHRVYFLLTYIAKVLASNEKEFSEYYLKLRFCWGFNYNIL
jgi:hypothetical protein